MSSRGGWRCAAASLALAAGVLHLAQIGPHADEGPLFVAFFAAVASLQIAGGLYLLHPLGPPAIRAFVGWFGIVGSLATIAIWFASRTFGLPFGAEPGTPQTVGLADAAAGIFEVFTALLIGLWLLGDRVRPRQLLALGGAGTAGVLGGAWLLTRALGLFAPDPRLVAFSDLADGAALALIVLVATLMAGAAFLPPSRVLVRGPVTLLLVALVAAELSLVVFTLPARGGQNRDCLYGPIREDSGLSHAQPPEPIRLQVGERLTVLALLLVPCVDHPVTVTGVELARPLGNAIRILSIGIDRSRSGPRDRVRLEPPAEAAAGASLVPGAGRYPIVIEIQGVTSGEQAVSAFWVSYRNGQDEGRIGFASVIDICVGDAPCLGR